MFGKKETIFDIAKKTGKKVVFILFEDKVYVTLAEKKEDGTIRFSIRRGYRSDTVDLQITPDQEFLLHSPKVQLSPHSEDIYEYLLNFDIDYLPKNPKDVQFSLQPYDVECLFLVYPHEILSVDTLKSLGLVETDQIQKNVVLPDGSTKTLKLKVYSPSIFALDKKTVKLLSAKSRISQIDTILTMTRDLLLRGESLYGIGASPNIFKMLFNRRILIPLILITIVIVAAVILSQFMGGITASIGRVVVPPQMPKPTFP